MSRRPKRRVRAKTHDDVEFARWLRSCSTDPETLLWANLRRRQLEGFKFRRQHPLGPYTLGFYCASSRLAVELDGASHGERSEYDRRRDAWLDSLGLRTLRFANERVVQDIDHVLSMILRAARDGAR